MTAIEHKLRGVLKGMETFFKELLAVDQLVKALHEMIEGGGLGEEYQMNQLAELVDGRFAEDNPATTIRDCLGLSI